MNCLVTLNLNHYLPTLARESLQAAALRWGVTYLEITEPLADIHHFWQKALMPACPQVASFERVLQLDGDMLIRSDCPNPFDFVPPELFGVVSRVQPGRPRHIARLAAGRRTARLLELPMYRHGTEHINAGFMLYNTSLHADLLNAWQQVGRQHNWPKVPFPEQVALSCILAQSPGRVMWLPWQFNTCSVNMRFPSGRMQAFIYHLHRPHPHGLQRHLERYQWNLS